jgi:hypothetical protein
MVGLCLSAPALADGYTTITQTFDVQYALHGSTGSDYFYLYDGPLKLYAVTIDWAGGAGSSYYLPVAPGEEGDHFVQPYEGAAGFYTYALSWPSAFPGGGQTVSFSGTSDCTYYECSVGGEASGTYSVHGADLAGWTGNEIVAIDSASYVNPSWCCGYQRDEYFSSGVSGTITYTLGPVPEPASWAMMLGGLGLVGRRLRSGRAVVRQA